MRILLSTIFWSLVILSVNFEFLMIVIFFSKRNRLAAILPA